MELFEREDALLLFLGDEDLLFEREEVGAMASMTQTWCDLLIRLLTVQALLFSSLRQCPVLALCWFRRIWVKVCGKHVVLFSFQDVNAIRTAIRTGGGLAQKMNGRILGDKLPQQPVISLRCTEANMQYKNISLASFLIHSLCLLCHWLRVPLLHACIIFLPNATLDHRVYSSAQGSLLHGIPLKRKWKSSGRHMGYFN